MTGARIGTAPTGAEINSRLGFEINPKFFIEYSFSLVNFIHILDLKIDLEPFILVVTKCVHEMY